MKYFTLLLFFSVIVNAALAERFVYLSAGGKVTVFSVDEKTGKLAEIQSVPGAGITAITRDQKRLYRVGGKQVESYEIENDGKLKSIGKDATTEKGGYLALDSTERFLAGSDYGGGKATVWGIGENGVAKGKPVAQMELEKAAHSSVFSPDNRFLLVPATTPNKVFHTRFNERTGAIVAHDPPFVFGPKEKGDAQQPRHLIFHPRGDIAYTTLEREVPGVGVWKWDGIALSVIQNIPTTPEGYQGSITTADLHLTPNQKFLYVSNRDLTDRKANTGNSTIVGFRVNEGTGKLTLIGHTPCPQVPRAFAIDRAGEFMYVAGQTAAKLAIYRIDQENGGLAKVDEIETGKGPNWVRCVTLGSDKN